MANPSTPHFTRRSLLKTVSSALAGTALASGAWPSDMPGVTHPRATSGDEHVEPDWENRLTLTVGAENADLCGSSDKVIQAAADYVARLGGGTVHVLPGEYAMRNAVYLPSGVRLTGSGTDSVLVKAPCVETTLEANSDWYDQEVTLADAAGFDVGDGICLITDNPHHGGLDVLKRTLVARSGKRFKLDKPLRKNMWVAKAPSALSLFPLLTAENASDIVIEDIRLDGNKAHNPPLNGNYSGCIWFQDCSRLTMRGVTAHNQNGDGISFQICHDVVVENCHLYDNTDLGVHPGSGSQRPLIRGNRIERNGIGIFFCWGVTYGLAEKNTIHDSGKVGISIGHLDSNNLIRENEVTRSGQAGVLFREDREGFAPTANRLESNRIIDNGPEDGAAVDVQGTASANTIASNLIRETRGPATRTAIRIGPNTRHTTLTDNTIEGYATPVSPTDNA